VQCTVRKLVDNSVHHFGDRTRCTRHGLLLVMAWNSILISFITCLLSLIILFVYFVTPLNQVFLIQIHLFCPVQSYNTGPSQVHLYIHQVQSIHYSFFYYTVRDWNSSPRRLLSMHSPLNHSGPTSLHNWMLRRCGIHAQACLHHLH